MNRDITITYSKSDDWWKNTLEDLWVTILEGGSNYWVDKIDHNVTARVYGNLDGSGIDATFKSELPSLKNGEHLMQNFEVIVHHGAEPDYQPRGSITLHGSETVKVKTFDVIYNGIKLLSDDVKMIIMNNGDWDANDADHIFQLGVFGEVRYG